MDMNVGWSCDAVEKDVFDKLFADAPEKLEPVKRVGVPQCHHSVVVSPQCIILVVTLPVLYPCPPRNGHHHY